MSRRGCCGGGGGRSGGAPLHRFGSLAAVSVFGPVLPVLMTNQAARQQTTAKLPPKTPPSGLAYIITGKSTGITPSPNGSMIINTGALDGDAAAL